MNLMDPATNEAGMLAIEARKALDNARRWRRSSVQQVIEAEAEHAHRKAIAEGWEREVDRLAVRHAYLQREYARLRYAELTELRVMTWADLSQ